MGPLGVPETIFIFILALLLFGPKKLPELGRMFGKALMEFRRASNELKSTFDREMSQIERETQSLKDETHKYTNEIYNYDSYYDSGSHTSESYDYSTANDPAQVSASAVQGAESTESTTSEEIEGSSTHTEEPATHSEAVPASQNGTASQIAEGHAQPDSGAPAMKS